MKNITNVTIIFVSMILFIVIRFSSLLAQNTNNYEDLHALFFEWRKFENPPLLDGAPNYTKSQFRKRQKNTPRHWLIFIQSGCRCLIGC